VAVATPRLSETSRTTSIQATLAIYWHLLSLDAPTVAALWCWSFGRAAHVDLPPLSPWLLAVGTWLVYVADRLLDGLDPANREHLRERHYYYSQHRKKFLAAGLIVSPVFIWIVFNRLAPAVLLEDCALFAVAALYFLLVHVHGRAAERWLPKELAVGVLFAAGTAVPTWARIPGDRLTIAPVIAVFAILCWLNCVAIERWEDAGNKFAAHPITVWAGRNLKTLAAVTVAISLVLAGTSLHDGARLCVFLACGSSALLLFLLAHHRDLTVMQMRIAADAILLTPLLFAVWMR